MGDGNIGLITNTKNMETTTIPVTVPNDYLELFCQCTGFYLQSEVADKVEWTKLIIRDKFMVIASEGLNIQKNNAIQNSFIETEQMLASVDKSLIL